MAKQILAFDIGIKNLAWCCLRKEESGSYTILGWDNYNLLSDSSNVGASKGVLCPHCKAKGLYACTNEESAPLYCARHALKPVLRDLSGNLLKKLPVLATCKSFLEAHKVKPPSKKDQVIEELSKLYALPRPPQKVSKAPDANLATLHDSMRKLVLEHKDMWSACTLICLENQPAYKNPTMKSVQILLYATLRDLLQPYPPTLRLVHAGKKVQVDKKGDDGYKDRKAGGEARAQAFLNNTALKTPIQWITVWHKAAKKSDLADALCMCLDASA